LDYAHTISQMGVGIISLADTVGSAEPAIIRSVYEALIPQLPEVEIGAHFHATPSTWEGKIAAAYEAGCRRFDGALKGYGGCPFAKDELTGNVATENIIHFLEQNGERTGIDLEHFTIAMKMAGWVFGGSKE
jgi:hydroxymethylglutaryl-CoA lyase